MTWKNNWSASNKIAASDQATPGVEGYAFDGIDGSQLACWTCSETARSASHVHDFDEYMVVIEGCFTLFMEGKRVQLNRGDECLIPRGVAHSGEVLSGTRTIHAFGGRRAKRAS